MFFVEEILMPIHSFSRKKQRIFLIFSLYIWSINCHIISLQVQNRKRTFLFLLSRAWTAHFRAYQQRHLLNYFGIKRIGEKTLFNVLMVSANSYLQCSGILSLPSTIYVHLLAKTWSKALLHSNNEIEWVNDRYDTAVVNKYNEEEIIHFHNF